MSVYLRRIWQDEAVEHAGIIVKAYAEPPWSELWLHENAKSRLTELVTTPGFIGVGAFLNHEAIGFAFALPHTSVIGRGMSVAEVAILPQYQRMGTGSILLARLEEEARQAGYLHIWLVSQRAGGVAEYYLKNKYIQSMRLGIYTKRLE